MNTSLYRRTEIIVNNKKPLFFLMTLLLLVSVCLADSMTVSLADGMAVIMEVCTNETDLSVYVKNAGSSLTDVTAQIGTAAGSQASCQSIRDTEFETLILIDNSLSIPKDMRSRTAEFLEVFFGAKAQKEKVAIGVFSRDITYLTGFTSDIDALRAAAAAVEYQNQDTYITDMLYELWRDDYSGAGRDVYRRIIIIADGVDDESIGYGVDELRQLIRDDTYPVYTIGCKTGKNDTQLESLFSLSRQTNAEYFLMDSPEDISMVADALGKDQEIVKVVVTPTADLMDGSVRSVKINFPGQSVSREIQMPQQEKAVDLETAEEESQAEESSAVETEEPTEEETPAVDSEALRKAAARKFILIVIMAWILIIAAFVTFIVVRHYRKKSRSEQADAQRLMERRKKELKEALPDAAGFSIVLTDIHKPQRSFDAPMNNEVVIGRNSGDCDIVIDYEASISGKHCVVCVSGHKILLRDLNSTNGTFVNGHRISGQTELRPGDLLALGKLELRVSITDR